MIQQATQSLNQLSQSKQALEMTTTLVGALANTAMDPEHAGQYIGRAVMKMALDPIKGAIVTKHAGALFDMAANTPFGQALDLAHRPDLRNLTIAAAKAIM